MKFYRRYKLKKDLPQLEAGSLIKWNLWREMYDDVGDYFGTQPPEPKVSYSKEFIDSKPEWFEPIGKEEEFYPKFPSEEVFFDRDDGHSYLGEIRHNNMCRICQLINKLDIDSKLKSATYAVFKEEYEKKFKL